MQQFTERRVSLCFSKSQQLIEILVYYSEAKLTQTNNFNVNELQCTCLTRTKNENL